MANSFYIYAHMKLTDGTPFYIGKGVGRRAFSKSKSQRSKWWHKTVKKYGLDILFLEKGLTEEEAFDREKYWISKIGRRDLGNGPLVNMTNGGDGVVGNIMSEESKKLISKNNARYNLGIEFKESTKKLMSEAKKKKIIDNSTGIIYESIGDAAKACGVNYSTLSKYLIGVRTNKTNLKYYE